MARTTVLDGKRILLVITGGIAAYKCLELIRRLVERGARVRAILTRAGAEFVTPLSVASLSGEKVYGDLFSLTDESEIGHIRLSRDADLVVIAPATADFMAKMATGLADDLASTALLATDKPVLMAPAMHAEMWRHPATQRNLARLEGDGVERVGPVVGELASGDFGEGRMAEVEEILAAIEARLAPPSGAERTLAGRRALVTSGPTYEAIDPVRFLANRSSGKQGHAIALALSRLGAECTLVSGPTAEPDPDGVTVVHIESARQMLSACVAALPVDVAVCAAAVSDWRVASEKPSKLKKNGAPPPLELVENPDILATLCGDNRARPTLVVGFAAETENLIENAREKRVRKGCDWIVANDVAAHTGTFGGECNSVHLITAAGADAWPRLGKDEVAARLARCIADHLNRASGAE
ncbi:MAG: bifunctional phosphopantothenoylcysteine decarboxylase/phosphopantothenate--cysteine ligase CoaBC [Alphaproteobacteria bacterium]|nr:bifunctional phosphopantothenoylcysteine decarboxylase/phosphopantothenate--cysteine ligase CoaBC [Alphaproteobacteria bacterium]